MADLITMLSAVAGQQGEEADEDFNQTVLLLHGDGTNGAQNNTFLDSSTNNFTITRSGNTTQGTFSPFSLAAGEWSNFFDGNGDFLSLTATSALQLENTTAFAIEFWVYPVSLPSVGGSHFIIRAYNMSSPFQGYGIAFGGNASNTNLQLWNGTAWADIGAVSTNTWTHIAVTYEGSGSTLRYFINGTQQGSATTVPSTINWTGTQFILGARNSDFYFNGYLSNVRVVKGSAVYTSNFTPPTTPLTAITNTSLLTCQSNRFVDNSTNAFAITRNGDVKVTPFSPFAPSAAYSAGTNGGSGYFGGDGNYLSAPYNSAFDFSTGDFTVECFAWVIDAGRSNDSNKYGTFVSGGANLSTTNLWSTTLLITSGVVSSLQIDVNGSSVLTASGQSIPLNAWHHFVFCRTGTTLSIFVNGSRVGTTTYSSAINTNSGGTVQIARNAYGGLFQNWLSGYIANARIIKGSGPYDATQTTLTVPTAPLTAISNTSLLCNFTNAGIFDNTGKNNLETVGNAQIDTTTKKFGTGSMEFDGNGDWLYIPDSDNWDFGSGNFTIEFWYNADSLAAFHVLLQQAASTTSRWILYWSATNGMVFDVVSGSVIISVSQGATTGWSTGTWYHVALVRNGNNFAIYRNGTSIASATDSDAIPNYAAPLYIGGGAISGDVSLDGFIDDLRITKGVARYTAAFTPPTKAFPDQ